MRILIIPLFLTSSIAGFGQYTKSYSAHEVEAKLHAMAFGAILASFNGDDPVTLNKDDGDATRQQESLAKWWNVHSREELLALLEGMTNGKNGHRVSFWKTQQQFRNLEPGMLWPTIFASAKAGEDIEDLILVASYIHAPPDKCLALTAWDFGRYINLCRWGWDAGYLNETEMWERMMPVARLLQKSYSSWSEFASDYMRGREYYSAPATRESGAKMQQTVNDLLAAKPKGAWKDIEWSAPLTDGPVAVDQFAEKIKSRAADDYPKADASNP